MPVVLILLGVGFFVLMGLMSMENDMRLPDSVTTGGLALGLGAKPIRVSQL